MTGNLVWDICTYIHIVTSKAGLTNGVVFHKGGLSKGYYCTGAKLQLVSYTCEVTGKSLFLLLPQVNVMDQGRILAYMYHKY